MPAPWPPEARDGRRRSVSDAARLFRRALERGEAGARYHVESITPDEAPDYYGWLAQLATLDLPASGTVTRQQLDWVPTGPGLLTDLREADYDAT